MTFQSIAKRSFCWLIMISFVLSIMIIPGTIVQAAEPLPVFTNADRQIPGLGLEIDESFDAPYKTDGMLGFNAIYQRQTGNDWIKFTLKIMYFYDVDPANEFSEYLIGAMYVNENYVQYIQKDPFYETLDLKLESQYRSFIWGPKVVSAEERPWYTANRLIRPDDHYFITIEGEGRGFTGKDEIKQLTDTIEQHARSVVAQKKGGNNLSQTTTSPEIIPEGLQAWQNYQKEAGMIRSHSGRTEVQMFGTTTWEPARNGMKLYTGDTVRTLAGGRAQLEMYGGRVINLYEESALTPPAIDPKTTDITAMIYFLKGRFWQFIEHTKYPGVYDKTQYSTSCCKGTEYEIVIEEDGTTTYNVVNGIVEVSDIDLTKTVKVNAGQTTTVVADSLPSEPNNFDTTQLDRWWEYPPKNKTNILVFIVPIVIVVTGILIFVLLRKRRKSAPQSG